MLIFTILSCLILNLATAWENLPQLPAGRRAEYYLRESDGGYKYGYDTGLGAFAKQSGDSANEVEGHFAFPTGGRIVDVKYTAGTQGYVPVPAAGVIPVVVPAVLTRTASSGGDESGTGDASYSFSYDAGSSSRRESSDSTGNVRGEYSFTNGAGQHNLIYEAGAERGFEVKGGSLATPSPPASPNSLQYSGNGGDDSSGGSDLSQNSDGSYSFGYSTADSSRSESSDASGNVRGRYSFRNNAGSHDLSYEAGAEKGFVVTGGSLAAPNGVLGKSAPAAAGSATAYSTGVGGGSSSSSQGEDGSYSFSYDGGSSSRSESGDSAGNVRGRYAYTNDAGSHDLSYEAGADRGFVVTGGSLAAPNGLEGKSVPAPAGPATAYSSGADGSSSSSQGADGSYSFSYNSDTTSRQESADAAGNVQGRYAYTNDAGSHDLSYEAGAEKGFVVTGGSLAAPNGLVGRQATASTPAATTYLSSPAGSSIDSSSGGDGSYSFAYDAGSSSRSESADAAGNVQGRYAFTNDAGSHDLSYEAGAEKGFVVTGGSLADSNGLAGRQAPAPVAAPAPAAVITTYSATSGGSANTDKSYSFSYDAGSSSRSESADAAGNLQGRYAYTNDAGHHDLSYEAGAEKGFVVTGGSLADPNGLAGRQAPAPAAAPAPAPVITTYSASSDGSANADGSYSFSYDAGLSSRSESADAAGNVQGRYAYTNDAGHHDLSYEAGAEKGFVVTGGSLSAPNGLAGKQLAVVPLSTPATKSADAGSSSAAMNEDGSYSFAYDAGSSSRSESGDAAGNVQGRYAYSNEAGHHDLSYEAGAERGFVVTGGSLAAPNGLVGRQAPTPAVTVTTYSADGSSDGGSSSTNLNPDGSFSFSYNAGSSSRSESSDSAGNVQGRYAYTNDAGHHDLSYEAGAEKGFVVKGGSLAVPNGLDGGATVRLLKEHAASQASRSANAHHGADLATRTYLPPHGSSVAHAKSVVLHPGNLIVTKYLPVQENHKVGYVLDSH